MTIDCQNLVLVARSMEPIRVIAADLERRHGAQVRGGSGRILLVASIGGHLATPTYSAYSASKSHVLLFREALHEEFRSRGVTVKVLPPGITASGFLAAHS